MLFWLSRLPLGGVLFESLIGFMRSGNVKILKTQEPGLIRARDMFVPSFQGAERSNRVGAGTISIRGVVQLVEQRSPKPSVGGSSPSSPAVLSVGLKSVRCKIV